MNKHTGSKLQLPALDPATVTPRAGSGYPTREMRAGAEGRKKRRLGDAAGLSNFGVNLVELAPGASSALRHWHTRQDEFILVISGQLTLVTDQGEQLLGPGMCAGFPAGRADGHHLRNQGEQPASYLEVGDRLPGDEARYPDVDLMARSTQGPYEFLHADGKPYERE